MAYINTQKRIEESRKIRSAYYDMPCANLKEIIDRNGNRPFNLVTDGFDFGFIQGYKQAKAEMKNSKKV